MFNALIPAAHAQGFTGLANNAAEKGTEAATSGLEGLVSYVFNNIDNWIAGIVVALIFFILSKMAAKAIKEAIINKKGEDVQEASLVLVERITVISITGVGLTIALAINGLNFTALVGAFSLGVGFALKDIIGNFISGVIMLSQDQVRIGHFIKTQSVMGKIVSIDTRATVLKAIDGTEVVIPNQNMLNQTIINYSINPFRRVEVITYVSWDSDLNKAIDLIHEVLNQNEDILKVPKSNVFLHNLEDDANLVIRVLFWVETGKKWLQVRSDVHRAILATFDKNGIQIDYSIRTLKLGREERSYLGSALGVREPSQLQEVVTAQEVMDQNNLSNTETAEAEAETARILEENAAKTSGSQPVATINEMMPQATPPTPPSSLPESMPTVETERPANTPPPTHL